MKNLYIIFLIALFSCNNNKVPTIRNFDRYTIGFTSMSEPGGKLDSIEITSTLCYKLLVLSKNNYCEMLVQKNDTLRFYKGYASKEHADSLIKIIEAFNKENTETYNYLNSCAPEINMVLETDTNVIYKYSNHRNKELSSYVSTFATMNHLKETDTIENVLKYKFYITNRLSYLRMTHHQFSPINDQFIPIIERKQLIHCTPPQQSEPPLQPQ